MDTPGKMESESGLRAIAADAIAGMVAGLLKQPRRRGKREECRWP
jgi:hypothetical protein